MVLLQSEKIPLGWSAPAFQLPDPSGQMYSLPDFTEKPALLVIFTCNHCPYARAAWPLLADLYNKFNDDVSFVAINSNDEQEFPLDGIEGMKETLGEFHIRFPYLRDETQAVAKSYQAQCTPDIYLFRNEGNQTFTLQYHGRINDNWQHPELVTDNSLTMAIKRLLSDQDPILDQHPSMGCSIKWKE